MRRRDRCHQQMLASKTTTGTGHMMGMLWVVITTVALAVVLATSTASAAGGSTHHHSITTKVRGQTSDQQQYGMGTGGFGTRRQLQTTAGNIFVHPSDHAAEVETMEVACSTDESPFLTHFVTSIQFRETPLPPYIPGSSRSSESTSRSTSGSRSKKSSKKSKGMSSNSHTYSSHTYGSRSGSGKGMGMSRRSGSSSSSRSGSSSSSSRSGSSSSSRSGSSSSSRSSGKGKGGKGKGGGTGRGSTSYDDHHHDEDYYTHGGSGDGYYYIPGGGTSGDGYFYYPSGGEPENVEDTNIDYDGDGDYFDQDDLEGIAPNELTTREQQILQSLFRDVYNHLTFQQCDGFFRTVYTAAMTLDEDEDMDGTNEVTLSRTYTEGKDQDAAADAAAADGGAPDDLFGSGSGVPAGRNRLPGGHNRRRRKLMMTDDQEQDASQQQLEEDESQQQQRWLMMTASPSSSTTSIGTSMSSETTDSPTVTGSSGTTSSPTVAASITPSPTVVDAKTSSDEDDTSGSSASSAESKDDSKDSGDSNDELAPENIARQGGGSGFYGTAAPNNNNDPFTVSSGGTSSTTTTTTGTSTTSTQTVVGDDLVAVYFVQLAATCRNCAVTPEVHFPLFMIPPTPAPAGTRQLQTTPEATFGGTSGGATLTSTTFSPGVPMFPSSSPSSAPTQKDVCTCPAGSDDDETATTRRRQLQQQYNNDHHLYIPPPDSPTTEEYIEAMNMAIRSNRILNRRLQGIVQLVEPDYFNGENPTLVNNGTHASIVPTPFPTSAPLTRPPTTAFPTRGPLPSQAGQDNNPSGGASARAKVTTGISMMLMMTMIAVASSSMLCLW